MKPGIIEVNQDIKNYFRILILISLICLTLLACSNPVDHEGNLNKTTYTSDDDKIIGRWRWVQSIGGIAGIKITPESSGRSEMFDFDDNNNLKQFINDSLAVENNYQLGLDVTIFSNDTIQVIYLDDILSFGYCFEDNDSLILYDNFIDGFARYFERE
ncbi:hypothetical protein ACFL40_06105 [candidate division KSB1 bacterium]